MSATLGRQPPRFVPTLTDVVPQPLQLSPEAPEEPAPVVDLQHEAAPVDTNTASHAHVELESGLTGDRHIQEHVMAHLDAVLPAQLEAVVQEAVRLQAQQLYATMRQDIAQVVEQAVREAIRQQMHLGMAPSSPA